MPWSKPRRPWPCPTPAGPSASPGSSEAMSPDLSQGSRAHLVSLGPSSSPLSWLAATVPRDSHNQAPQAGGLRTGDIYSLPDVEAGSPRSRSHLGHTHSGGFRGESVPIPSQLLEVWARLASSCGAPASASVLLWPLPLLSVFSPCLSCRRTLRRLSLGSPW